MSNVVVHWDEAAVREVDQGPFGVRWTNLGEAAGTRSTGVRRMEIQPGRRSTAAHAHTAEEEIFFVLGGSGLSWQDGQTFEVSTGDCLVHLPRAEAHTLVAGHDGLDALLFSTRDPSKPAVCPGRESRGSGPPGSRAARRRIPGLGRRPRANSSVPHRASVRHGSSAWRTCRRGPAAAAISSGPCD